MPAVAVQGTRHPGSPRKEDRRSKKTHFKDLEQKKERREENSSNSNKNLTESVAEDKDKVADKERIGRKKKKKLSPEGRDEEEEELLQCLQLIEIAKDRLLHGGGGGGGLEQEEGSRSSGKKKIDGEQESTDVSMTLSRFEGSKQFL